MWNRVLLFAFKLVSRKICEIKYCYLLSSWFHEKFAKVCRKLFESYFHRKILRHNLIWKKSTKRDHAKKEKKSWHQLFSNSLVKTLISRKKYFVKSTLLYLHTTQWGKVLWNAMTIFTEKSTFIPWNRRFYKRVDFTIFFFFFAWSRF